MYPELKSLLENKTEILYRQNTDTVLDNVPENGISNPLITYLNGKYFLIYSHISDDGYCGIYLGVKNTLNEDFTIKKISAFDNNTPDTKKFTAATSICYGQGVYIIAGQKGQHPFAIQSSDLNTWTEVFSYDRPYENMAYNITYNNNKFVLYYCGPKFTNPFIYIYSKVGSNQYPYEQDFVMGANQYATHIGFDKGFIWTTHQNSGRISFVQWREDLRGDSDTESVSPWVSSNNGTILQRKYFDGKFMVVGGDGTNAEIAWSTELRSGWQNKILFKGKAYCFEYVNNIWICGGENYIAFSTKLDGEWNLAPFSYGTATSIVGADDGTVLIGYQSQSGKTGYVYRSLRSDILELPTISSDKSKNYIKVL